MKPLNKLALSVLLAAVAAVAGCALSGKTGEQDFGMTSSSTNAARVPKGNELNKDEASLRYAAEQFIEAADRSDSTAVASMYAPDFVNIRVTDTGEVVRLDRAQLLSILGRPGGHHIPTKSTVIQHIEVVGDNGFVLLTRIKDLGSGYEPMFYSLVWQRQGERWLLSREFVHQRSLPKNR